MQRRLISADSRGLLPVISQRALFRRCNIWDSPRSRSVQHGTVTTDASADESSTRFSLRLSRRMIGRPVISSAVIIFRTSSSLSGNGPPFGRRTGRNDADQAGQQPLAGALSGRLDQVYRSKAVDHALAERGEGLPQWHARGPNPSRTGSPRAVHPPATLWRARSVLRCGWVGTSGTSSDGVGEHPQRIVAMVTGRGYEHGVFSECRGANHRIQRRKRRNPGSPACRGRCLARAARRCTVSSVTLCQLALRARMPYIAVSPSASILVLGARRRRFAQGATVLEEEWLLSSVRLLGGSLIA